MSLLDVLEGQDGSIPWEAIDALVKGAALLKFGRSGEPHFRQFSLDPDCEYLRWVSDKKTTVDSRVLLCSCMLLEGQSTEVFRRQPRPDLDNVSFSLLYDAPGRRGASRTLDVVCKDRQEYETWVTALNFLIVGPPPRDAVEARARALWGVSGGLERDRGLSPTSPGGGEARPGANIRSDLKKRIKDTNDVYSFGSSPWGQLGLGDEGLHAEPVIVSALLGKAIKMVAVGSAHAVALAEGGETYVMGHGGCGRLGTGGVDSELLPRMLLRPPSTRPTLFKSSLRTAELREPWRFMYVACGDLHTVAVGADGVPFAWGSGYQGALGGGVRNDALVPTPITALVGARRDGGGAPSLALCVGSSAPKIVGVAAGAGYTALSDSNGRLYTCGVGGGPLGHDRSGVAAMLQEHPLSSAPLPVGSAPGAGAGVGDPPLTIKEASTCLAGYCGGGDLLLPLQVGGGEWSGGFGAETVVSVSAGDLHMAVATGSGACFVWGWNGSGALGLRDTVDRPTPTRVDGLPKDVLAVACGAAHTLALLSTRGGTKRSVWASGATVLGAVPPVGSGVDVDDALLTVAWRVEVVNPPDPATSFRPVELPLPPRGGDPEGTAPPPQPCAIAAGAFHSAVITDDGALYTWGDGSRGELGISKGGLPDAWRRAKAARAGSASSHLDRGKGASSGAVGRPHSAGTTAGLREPPAWLSAAAAGSAPLAPGSNGNRRTVSFLAGRSLDHSLGVPGSHSSSAGSMRGRPREGSSGSLQVPPSRGSLDLRGSAAVLSRAGSGGGESEEGGGDPFPPAHVGGRGAGRHLPPPPHFFRRRAGAAGGGR